MLNKSFWAMQQDLKHGNGLAFSIFSGQSVTAKDRQAILDFNTQLQNGVQPARAWATTMSNCSIAAQTQARQCLKAKGSLSELANGFETMTFSAKAGAVALKALSIAGNMLLFMVIGKAISFATEKITELANASKIAEEKATAFANSANSSIKEMSNSSSTLSSLNDEYKRLSEGVNALGENVSLSADEYDRYKEIIDQISGIMPNMTTYFNSQGEAIAFTQGKLSDLNEEYEKYIQKQAKAFMVNGDEDGNTTQDALDNFENNSKMGFWEGLKNSFKNAFGSYDIDDLPVDTMLSTFEDIRNKSKEELIAYFSDIDLGANGEYIPTQANNAKAIAQNVLGVTISEIEEMTDEEFNTLQQSIASNIQSLKNDYDVDMSAITAGLIQSAYSKDDFWAMGEELRNDVTTLLSSLDADTWKSLGITEQSQLESFVGNIINNISSNKNGFADAWNSLFELDKSKISASDYISQANSFIDTICNGIGIEGEDNRRQFKISLGFDTDVDQGMIDGLKKKLTTSSSKATAGMSKVISDSIQKANNQVAIDWIDSLNANEVELANSDEFEQALEKQKEKLNGAALSAEDYEAALQSVKDAQGELNENPISTFSDAWSQLQSSTDDATKELADNLTELAEQGRLTIEAFNEADSTDYFENLGISAEEAVKSINDLVSASTQLQSMSAQISKMSDMLAEKKKGNTAQASDLAGFDAEVRGLDSWEEFEAIMGSSKSTMEQCQKAANNLATEFVNSNNFLANLNETNKDYYVTALQNMGVENAEEIVKNALTLATQAQAAAEEFLTQKKRETENATYSLINATAAEIQKFAEEKGYADNVTNALIELALKKQLVNGTTLDFSGDLANISNYVKALGSTANAIGLLNRIKNGEVYMPGDAMPSVIASAQAEIDAALANTKKTNVQVNPVGSYNYKPSGSSGGSGSKGSSTKKEPQEIDWAANSIENLINVIDKLNAKLEKSKSYKTQLKYLKQIRQETENLAKGYQKQADAYKKYWEKAASKISKSQKEMVMSGKTFSIKEYGEDTYKKLTDAQDAWKQYQEATIKAIETQQEAVEAKIAEYQRRVDYQQSRVDKLEAQSAVTTSTQKKNEIENKRLKALKEQYKYEIKIAKAEGDTIKAKQLELELEAEIIASKKAKFDNIVTKYENRANRKGYHLQDIENKVSLIEAKGSYVNGKYYDMQYEEQKALAKMYDEEEQKLRSRLDSIKKYSEEWYEALETIQDVQNKANDARIAMQEAADKMNDLASSLDDLIINKFSTLINEANTLMELLGDRLVDDDIGDFTDKGVAALGLFYAQMQAENEKGDQLRKQLAVLEEQMASYQDGTTVSFIDANGMKRTISSLKELKELEEETRKNIQESSKAEYTYYKNIIDLMKERYEAEKDYLDDLISKKKELLDAEQDLHQYAKDIKEQTDNIASLQKQLAALSGDNSLEGQARRQKLEAQLKESKDTLAETEYDRLISDQKDMLDNLSAEYAEMFETYMKNDDALFREGLAVVKENAALINEVTTSVADRWGMELSGEMESVVGNINTVDSTLNGIRSDLQDYFAATQGKEETQDTFPNRHTPTMDAQAIRDSLKDTFDIPSRHTSDTVEGKDLNMIKDTGKPLIGSSVKPADKDTSKGTNTPVEKKKASDRVDQPSSFGKNDTGEVIRVDRGNGEILELVKKETPSEWQSFGKSLLNSAVNTTPNLEALTRQTIENAPMNIANTSNMNIENVSFSLPNVSNYKELMQEAQSDPNFEGMIGHMVDTKLTGSNRLNKYRTKF